MCQFSAILLFSSILALGVSGQDFRCQNGEISVIRLPVATTREQRGTTTTSSDATPSEGTTTTSSEGCERCDLAARHSCFLSLHLPGNITTEAPNADCLACEKCCNDAFPHKCEVWKNHDFCDMEWYSKDKKTILCGKTCGIC